METVVVLVMGCEGVPSLDAEDDADSGPKD